MEYFKESVQRDGDSLNAFCEALKSGNSHGVEKQFGDYLRKTISIRDTFVQKKMKENFYHWDLRSPGESFPAGNAAMGIVIS